MVITAAGLVDIEMSEMVDTFVGALGEVNAHKFGTFGRAVLALKPGRRREGRMATSPD